MFFDKRISSPMSRTAITLKFKMSRLLEKHKKENNDKG